MVSWPVLTLVPALALGQSSPAPVQNRPANFSQVVGVVRIESQASPTTVEVEKPLLLTVRILGDIEGPFAPRRQFLKLFPDHFNEQFFVEPKPELDRVLPGEKAWEFVYSLRPKNTAIEHIPGFKLVYYHPGRKKYATSFADPIPIQVNPASPPVIPAPPGIPIRAPASFFTPAPLKTLMASPAPPRPWWQSAAELLGLGLLAFVIFAPRFRGSRRHLIPRTAKLHLEYAGSVSQLRGAFTSYLQRRFHFSNAQWTGAELVERLRQLGFAPARLRQVESFYARCDQVRFAPRQTLTREDLEQWCSDTQRLVDSLENDPCVPHLA